MMKGKKGYESRKKIKSFLTKKRTPVDFRSTGVHVILDTAVTFSHLCIKIRIVKENDKSEPFTDWHKVRICTVWRPKQDSNL